MARFSCRCGHVIHASGEAPEEKRILSEADIEKKLDHMEETGTNMDIESFMDFLSEKATDAIVCPKCRRVYIDHNGDNRYTAYVNEDNPPAD